MIQLINNKNPQINPIKKTPQKAMKHHVFSSDEESHQNGVSKSSFWWWRANEEFDEDGTWKGGIGELSPRIRVLREMERLALIGGEGVDELRHKLLSYRAGDFWMPIGGIIKREEVDVPQVITVLLTGLVGSGKSSLINLMYSVLGRSGLIPFAQTSGESPNYTTVYLEEHNILRSPRSGLCVYDTKGLDPSQLDEGLDEVSTWMSEGVRHNQLCARSLADLEKVKGPLGMSSSRYTKRKVNYVMVVADLAQVDRAFKSGDMKSMEALRALFHLPAIKNSNENPILILTHGDTLNPQDRLIGRLTICEYLGIPETTGAYDIPCLTQQGILAEESDPVTAFALTEAVYRALLQSDRAHLPKKKLRDWMILILSWIMLRFASFFAALAAFFSKFEHHTTKLKM